MEASKALYKAGFRRQVEPRTKTRGRLRILFEHDDLTYDYRILDNVDK